MTTDDINDIERRLRAAVLEYTRGNPAVVTIAWLDESGQMSHWFEKVADTDGWVEADE